MAAGNLAREGFAVRSVVADVLRRHGQRHTRCMQDLIGTKGSTFGTVATFSGLASDQRRRGIGHEMRAAVLQLAIEGFAATEAHSEAFTDNHGSNKTSRDLGYEHNGVEWATRQEEPALMKRWRLTRDNWTSGRREDIELRNFQPCRDLLERS